MADPAKTAKKSTALPPRIVPKTSRYPMAENQAQSTRKSLVRPSTMKQATMTITATAMPLLAYLPPWCVRHLHFPVTGRTWGWRRAERRRGPQSARPADREPRPEREFTIPYPAPPEDFNRWIPAQEAAARSASAASGSTGAIMMRTRISCMSLNIGRRLDPPLWSSAAMKPYCPEIAPSSCATFGDIIQDTRSFDE